MALSDFAAFDVQRWPLVKVRFERAPVSGTREFQDFQERFCGLLTLGLEGDVGLGIAREPLSLIMHLDALVQASVAQQMQAAGMIAAVQPLVARGALQATALVVTSPAARTILQFITGLVPLKSENTVVASEDEACAWISSKRT